MSLAIAQDLLRKYNKNSPYTKKSSIDSKSDQSNKRFGTWSYANMYDALYEKYSQNKNFNVNMWHDAIKLGEQNQYLAFLEQNKDRTMSDTFYDPQYYDYETMMMEMYLPLVDNTERTMYTQDIFNPVSGKWETQELGEMTQREYYEYLLSTTKEARAQEITKDLEQWRKDQLGWWGQFGHDVLATLSEFGEGVLSGLAGIVDFIAGIGYASYAGIANSENWADAYVEYFGELGLTAAEKRTIRAALDEYERTHTHFRDIDGNMTGVGTYVAGIANSIGMMVPAIVANIATGGIAGLSWLGSTTFYMSIFSNNMYENATNPYRKDSPSWLKIGNAAIKTGVEAVIEWGLGKILGGTIQNRLIGVGGRELGEEVIKGFTATSGLKYFFKSAAQEGLEEFLQDFSTDCIDQFTDLIYEGYGNTGGNIQTLIDSFCVGALSSMFMSGGHIALSGAGSVIKNRKEAGSGDVVIETDEGPQKLRAFNKLYYSSILSDFKKAVDELQRGKISSTKNIELAQEVYGAMSAISQFYSSFDVERIKRCEMLLDRVVKAEKFKENHERAASILTDKTINKAVKQEVRSAAQTFAASVETTFRSMVGEATLRHASKLRAAAEKVGEKLTKEGGVTTVTGVVDTDGIQYKKDPQMLNLEAQLGKKAADNLDELRKGYDLVVTTDGHIAAESDGYLFVSEAWLQNYETSDIYKYLEQARIFNALQEILPEKMVKTLITFDKEFTGQTDVDAERALMDLLFNKSVYQAFLLSNAGENMHEFTDFIFKVHEIIKDLGQSSKYHQQLFKGKQSQKRINMLNQIYEQIKETMREPTVKAILTWGIEPQFVGADSVLTPTDRQRIKEHKQRRETLNGINRNRSAYENLAKEIITKGKFNKRELELIKKSINGTATLKEDLEARALLDEADRRIYRFDFEVSGQYSNIANKKQAIGNEVMRLLQTNDTDIDHWKDIMNLAYQSLLWIKSELFSKELEKHKEALLVKVEAIYDNKNATAEDYSGLINLCIQMLNRELQEIAETEGGPRAIGLGTFTIPYQAAAFAENSPADAQFITDKLDEFKKTYGISARQMFTGDLTGMSMAQRNQLTQDMEILGFTSDVDIVSFVIKKLEGMLGGKFVVTPTKTQIKDGKFVVKPLHSTRDFSDTRDFTKLSQDLDWSRQAVKRWIESHKRSVNRTKNETTAWRAVENFYDFAYVISSNSYSDFHEFLPDVEGFWKELSKLWQKEGSIQAIKYIIANRETIDNFYELLDRNLRKAAIDDKSKKLNSSEIYDFTIVKSIPAEQFISHDILDKDLATRNDIFKQMFRNIVNPTEMFTRISNELLRYDVHYDRLIDSVKERFSHDEIAWMSNEMSAIAARVEAGERADVVYGEFINNIVAGINPFTGEVFDDLEADDPILAELLHYDIIKNNTSGISLSKLIDISKFSVDLSDIRVFYKDAGPGAAGYAAGNMIVVDPVKDDDHFGTLVHEINHILQRKYDLPNGFNPNTAGYMLDFLAYVMNNYPDYVKYTLRRSYYESDIEVMYGEDGDNYITAEYLKEIPKGTRDIIAHCAYMLVQGELWARAYDHNGKMVHGFTEVFTKNGSFILSPDGLAKFKVRYIDSDIKSANETSYISKTVAGSALDVAIQKLFFMKQDLDRGNLSNVKDTYHSDLTKKDSHTLLASIMRPDIPLYARYTVKLTDVIRNPEQYLSQEILAKCNGDFSEGNVFYRIKEYVEKTHEGISIDIKDGVNPQYIFVDDNAFNDLLLPSINNARKNNLTTITENYELEKEIPLDDFYLSGQLAQLGINPHCRVILSHTKDTETIFDYKHSAGTIVINTKVYETNKDFVEALNHEFRHLLQYYNGFAIGFTADFKVTTEMLNDIKAHLPGLFKNQEIINWAKKVATHEGRTNYEEVIASRYVYYATSGELEAYGFTADELYAKPVFVTEEAGSPTIFMSWYNPKTGEGRYRTDYIGMKAEKTNVYTNEKYPNGAELPSIKKRSKHIGVKVDSLDDVDQMRTYIYNSRRYFTKDKAKNTNLKYFVKEGQRNQMDPELQEFIIATTGHEDKLPPELWNVIGGMHKGTLTKQALFRWFREVKTIDNFTFDLINKYIFKNNRITSMKELDDMLTVDPAFYWAAAVVLYREGLSLQSLIAENDVDKFLSFINSLKGTKWKDKILEQQKTFEKQWLYTEKSKSGFTEEDVFYNDKIQKYMRVLAMQWFDGTLAGAFYVANAARKTARKYELELGNVASLDKQRRNHKGENGGSQINRISNRTNPITGSTKMVANDIIAIYEEDASVPEDDMVRELSLSYYERLCKEAKIDPLSKSVKELKPIVQEVVAYQKKLYRLSIDIITREYLELKSAQVTDTQPDFDTSTSTSGYNVRESIQKRIQARGRKIVDYVISGKIAFNDLPKEIQEMFEKVDATTKDGRTTSVYQLKKDIWLVGKGRKALPGETDIFGRFNYKPKHNITDGNEAFRHDLSKIRANLEKLDNIVSAMKEYVKAKDNTLKKVYTRGEKAAESLERAINAQKIPKEKQMKTTEFKISKKVKRTSDTPNIFNITSGINMPHVLYKILDTSFEDMANTLVQFASRDENGQLYNKEQFKPGEFDSRVKHEVSNWDAFYEANRDALLSLSRNDVLDIVEFFQRGAMTIEGPVNKLAAFEIFLLGYIVDGARRNFNNWNFSDAEIEMVEKLYEQKASAHGSGLQAVQQMLKVVDPMKKVRQRMFDDWDAIGDDDKNKLIKAVDDLQRETDTDTRIKKAEAVQEMLKEFGQRQMVADEIKYPRWSKAWWGRVWSKVKSYRYMAMLSGPTTWIRNVVSNVLVTSFNKTSDVIGGVIFRKKGYRKEQWNLTGTKISAEAKTFIDTYILNNPVFTPLYDMSSKYDSRQTKKIKDERSLLVTLIAKAYEKQYAQDRRFDSSVMNGVAKFIDKMISDKKFVKFAAGRYFGKMLTIEAERGNIDLSQGLSSEAMDLFAESVILANQEYMHKRSFGADLLDGIRDKHPKMHEALTFWQPFLNSSLNWFVESLKYTPIGLADSIVRACRLEKQITNLNEKRAKGEMVADSRAAEFFIRRDIGKGVLGLMLSVFGIMLASSGRIRIDEDDDKFYMYVDEDIKLDITNLFGSSSVLVGASIAQMWIKQKDGDVASFEDMLSLLTDTMLEGFFATDLLERHKWGGTWDDLLTETESVMRSFVPQVWQTIIACTNQEKIRYSAGFKGMWERWLNTFVPTQPFGNRKINPYTGEIEDKYSLPIVGALLQKGILGPKIYWVEVSELERMCRELGVNKNELTGELTVNDNKYELDRLALNKKYGELNKESLAKIKSQKHKVEMPDGTFKTLSWDNMSDEQRARVISRTMTQNAEIAKIYIWTQTMNKKFYASESLWLLLRQLGIIRNVYKGDKDFVE